MLDTHLCFECSGPIEVDDLHTFERDVRQQFNEFSVRIVPEDDTGGFIFIVEQPLQSIDDVPDIH